MLRFPFEKFWIILNYPPSQPDCFVIPSYAIKDRQTPTLPTIAQNKLAYEWGQRYPQSVLIMCTGDNQQLGISNASIMANYASELRVPKESLIEEDRSLNTYQNLFNAQEIIRERIPSAYTGHVGPIHSPGHSHGTKNRMA